MPRCGAASRRTPAVIPGAPVKRTRMLIVCLHGRCGAGGGVLISRALPCHPLPGASIPGAERDPVPCRLPLRRERSRVRATPRSRPHHARVRCRRGRRTRPLSASPASCGRASPSGPRPRTPRDGPPHRDRCASKIPPSPLAATDMFPLIRKARPPNIFCSVRPASPASPHGERMRLASSTSYATAHYRARRGARVWRYQIRKRPTSLERAIRCASSPEIGDARALPLSHNETRSRRDRPPTGSLA